jgi:DNA replication initiation complex subunit (GINS family)
LSIFYFENENKHEISWRDETDPWSNQNDVANSIVIEVADVNKILQYGITFFVTTGTIRVQGSKYKHFAEKEFPILKEILAIVLDSMAKIDNAIDKHTEVEDETTLKTVDSAQSQNIDKDTNLADRSKATIQSDTSCELNLQSCFLDAIKKS